MLHISKSPNLSPQARHPAVLTPGRDEQPLPLPYLPSPVSSAADETAHDASGVYLHLKLLADTIHVKRETDHQLDVTPELEELWSCFCDAGMEPNSQQELVTFVQTILGQATTSHDHAEASETSVWDDLPQFRPEVQRKLRQSFMADLETSVQWINLNHLLARISIPPASIWDLRMVCLWNLRDVLETSSLKVTVMMLKILTLWLGGHIHWIQLQILRASSKSYTADSLIALEVCDLPNQVGTTLRPIFDLDRLNYWRQRLQQLRAEGDTDAAKKFYIDSVLSLLEVGIADVDEWKAEMPAIDIFSAASCKPLQQITTSSVHSSNSP